MHADKAGGRALCKRGISYAEARSRMRSFDLLFFRGVGCVSGCIRCSQRAVMHLSDASDYTHVGLCIRGDLFPRTSRWWSATTIYIFESSQGGYFCAPRRLDGRCACGGDGAASLSTEPDGSFTGTHLRDLDAVVATYDIDRGTRLGWAPLKPESRAIADRVTPEEWLAIFNRHNGTPYNFNAFDLCAALCPGMRACREESSVAATIDRCTAAVCYCAPAHRRWKFCSEVVEAVLIEIGVEAGSTDETLPLNTVPADLLTEQHDRVIHVERPIVFTLFTPPPPVMRM